LRAACLGFLIKGYADVARLVRLDTVVPTAPPGCSRLKNVLVPVGRGDIDNAAAALSLHDAHFVLHAQGHAENIRVERRGVAFPGLVRDWANLAFGPGIVHRDIETAKPCDGLVDQGADVILLADVGVDELSPNRKSAAL
jgi:hypothetical protein